MRALLVAHDPAVHDLVESTLLRHGWRVERADTLHDVEIMARALRPLLLVAPQDRVGPIASILETRDDPKGPSQSYLLAVVPPGDPEAVRQCLDSGADDTACVTELETRLMVAEARLRLHAGAIAPQPGGAWTEARADDRIPRALLEGLFQVAPEGVVILDPEDRVVRVNDEFTRLFGYTFAETAGRSIDDLIVPPELKSESVEMHWDLLRGERVMVETARRHREGHLIDVSVLATPIEADGLLGAVAIYRDITEKKAHEAALRDSEARYRALFDQSPVGVFLCDRDLRITHCNEQLTRIFGAAYEEMVGADLVMLRSGRLLPGIRAALGGEPAFYEGPYRARGGKQLHLSVQYAPLRDDAGEVVGGIGVVEDISDRVAAERQLRAQAAEMDRVNAALRERTLELEAAIQARSRLYSAVNHELRTPISAIMLYQELLIAGSLGTLGDEQLSALEHSHAATRHLLDLVRDILDLSKAEAGKVSVQPVEVCVRSLLTELQATVAPLTERYGSHLRLDVAPGVGKVVTDPQRVRQILMNFVSNAAKYGRRNPIDLRCRRSADGGLEVEVADRGIGIAEEHLEHIFEDFVQLGAEAEEGTGLGLAISQRLAELLDGRLEVESKPGVGSTFRLVLPATPPPGARPMMSFA